MSLYEAITIVLIIVLIFGVARKYFRRCEHSDCQLRIANASNDQVIYAPAYGKIVHKDKQTMSIFLSLTDIHRQYFPISGTVQSVVEDYTGQYAIANNIGKSQYNDKIVHTIVGRAGTVTVTQIAGFLIRRIDYNKSPDSQVRAGDPLGIIHFGSRVDIRIPENAEFYDSPQVGEKIKAGKPIGHFLGV